MELLYDDNHVTGSPFVAKAWDATNVVVSNIGKGQLGKPAHFKSNFFPHVLVLSTTYTYMYMTCAYMYNLYTYW